MNIDSTHRTPRDNATATSSDALGNMEIYPSSAESINRGFLSSMEVEIDSTKTISQQTYVDIDKDNLHDDAEFYEELRETEGEWAVVEHPNYIQNHPVFNEGMRREAVDWLMRVHLKSIATEETLFRAVNLMDYYLANTTAQDPLQLVGIAAFSLISKQEESDPLMFEELAHSPDNAFESYQMLQVECSLLSALDFLLKKPQTVKVFRVRFVKAALHGDTVFPDPIRHRQLNCLSAYYSQLSLGKCYFLRYRPSFIAAASVMLARITLGMTPLWHGTLSHYTKYEAEELLPCARALAEAARLASTEQQTTMRKFSHSRYMAVGTINPPVPF